MGWFESEPEAPVFRVMETALEDTQENCEALKTKFSSLALKERGLYTSMFTDTFGAITHMIKGHTDTVELGHGWRIEMVDGVASMRKEEPQGFTRYDLNDITEVGKYNYQGFYITVEEGVRGYMVTVQSGIGDVDFEKSEDIEGVPGLVESCISNLTLTNKQS